MTEMSRRGLFGFLGGTIAALTLKPLQVKAAEPAMTVEIMEDVLPPGVYNFVIQSATYDMEGLYGPVVKMVGEFIHVETGERRRGEKFIYASGLNQATFDS